MTSNHEFTFRPMELIHLGVDEAVNAVLLRTVRVGCSDLFFLTNADSVDVSVRRLGRITKLATLPNDFGRHIINHIKAEAGVDIAEQRRPLDGRWIIKVHDHELDLRINCIATVYGTDMSIRIWDHTTGLMKLEELGLSRTDLHRLTSMLQRPNGLILVTGPMGTGKTTTLYACLQFLGTGERKINTIEDPVEYVLPGVRQSQVAERYELGYSQLLRSILRQSPDIIMIGEIRDSETAVTAIRAATSGQLVLASMHSPIATSAIHSCLALGAHPHFLSSCLLGVVAQRLIRTLCPECRVYYDMSEATSMFDEVADLLEPGQGKAIYGPAGCDLCYGSGFSGRTGLFEILTITHELRTLIADARPQSELELAASRAGMVPLKRAALLRVAQGQSSTEDLLRNISAEQLGIED